MPDDPNWNMSIEIELFSKFVQRAKDDPAFARRCQESPEAAKKAAQEIADTMDPPVRIPDKEVVVLIPERSAEYCHVYSLTPKDGTRSEAPFDLKDYLVCCYDPYRQPDVQ